MTKERISLIVEHRRKQPITELRRKAEKASGRWSNRYWTAEELDLAHAEAEALVKYFKSNNNDENLL
jgi:hypothetical protein